ncbi:MAG: 30S ribosomal protein THX [Thermoflavifilum sp.]|nr:30S ribosomal protein THX [Thermoflavifilum sp.]
MGKGDIRSRRGKIWKGTFGKSRPARKQNKKRFPVAHVLQQANQSTPETPAQEA